MTSGGLGVAGVLVSLVHLRYSLWNAIRIYADSAHMCHLGVVGPRHAAFLSSRDSPFEW
jgi:hypothetical protein